ncbi:MAG: nicotinamide-nucleotide adenylyltransferase [Candidatus Aenigmarchaeota archaeon]|nr:nicotinamide-nucleotide adenylyltransferase [Candidatus Aenigmarchaeota archaeon]
MATALFVGRFQPFHNGHMEILESISRRYDKIIIIIGSADQKGTKENPFSVEERIEMIRLPLEARGIRNFEIDSVEDFHDANLWSSAIKKARKFDIVYSRNPWTLKCFRENGVKARKHKLHHERRYSGKEIRKRILKGRMWNTLVPEETYAFIRSVKGEERLRRLSE